MYKPPTEPETLARQRDADRTRAALLVAARTLFSTRGFANTGVRDVADLAGVNSSLVGRYFGSKQGLFRAALDSVLDISPVLRGDRHRFCADMVSALCNTPDARGPLAMMILSAADPEAHATSVELLQTKVLTPLAEWLGPPDGAWRAAQLHILWSGFLTSWRLLPIQALDDTRIASARRWLEAATQAIVDEGAP
ncbi:TetR/AcrR family transcriptional regulator [Polyangium sp. 15x6]|uniref:TetR/AcrR family transcriptional regulator n=1 Tax=Polyangium sp. 15x6 TaxID=3042687 RepID=UPI00249A3D0B|nr:TetR/AcrR family transcriptional regulator [Polyangium sp. 15x6]MDI3290599.1 TetR family transcriptional regulator [Polyangium sp. 15x6]